MESIKVGYICYKMKPLFWKNGYWYKWKWKVKSYFNQENCMEQCFHLKPGTGAFHRLWTFQAWVLMFKNKSCCLFYFNSVNLSFADMYSRLGVNKGFIIRRLKTNLSVWTWLRFDLNFVYEKVLPKILVPFMRFQLLPDFI